MIRSLPFLCLLLGLTFASAQADTHEEKAQQRVEALPCGDKTVGGRLAEEARAHSQRDLGWRFFREGDDLDVERAFRLTKSMEIHYRWRVHHTGDVSAVTEHAKKLCP